MALTRLLSPRYSWLKDSILLYPITVKRFPATSLKIKFLHAKYAMFNANIPILGTVFANFFRFDKNYG